MDLFTAKDFKVFGIPDFHERMAAIRTAIRPKLTSIGEALAPRVSAAVDRPLFVHVAKHARRTVNPPDDTWAAMGCNSRGYKMDVHFKVAVSRHCVRLLFEAGPEYYDKTAWARAWRGEHASLAKGLKGLSWFKNEHDEDPEAEWGSISDKRQLGEELIRRRDGQFVVGRRIDAKEWAAMNPKVFEKFAVETFTALSPLFTLCETRVIARGE